MRIPPPTLKDYVTNSTSIAMVVMSLTISFTFAILGTLEVPLLKSIDHFWYDTLVRKSPAPPSPQVTLVDIDDQSLALMGQWPWPRYRLAALIQKISAMGALAIGIDIILPEPDRTALMNVQKTFARDFGVHMGFKGVPLSLMDNDGYLGKILEETKTIGACYFFFDRTGDTNWASPPHIKIDCKTNLLNFPTAKGGLWNIRRIEEKLQYNGFINSQRDTDGLIRRVPLFIRYGHQIYPQLALATLMKALKRDTVAIIETTKGYVVDLKPYQIPVDPKGYIHLHPSGPSYSHRFVSAVDVLNETASTASFKNKIVFIGTSAVGLGDLQNTSFSTHFPGLEIHGVIISNILERQCIKEPMWTKNFIFLLVCSVGLIMAALFYLSPGPLVLFTGSAALIIGSLFFSDYAFQRFQVLISPGQPVVLVALLFCFFITIRFALEKRRSFLWYRMLANIQQVTLETMATIVETRDPETGEHIERTQHYAVAIAEHLYQKKRYPEIINRNYIDILFVSVPLHDIGKVGIPDRILLKPGSLTAEEFDVMRMHTVYGKDIITKAAEKIEGDNFLSIAGEVVATHHEKWDGTGYPAGLVGTEIPLSGRIMAIADVYDAMISKRIYKPAFTHEIAITYIKKGRGLHFDPVLVDVFLAIKDQIKAIALKYKDPD